MPKFLAIAVAALAAGSAANAAIVTSEFNLGNFLTPGGDSAANSRTSNFTFNDGAGNTVTLALAATSTGAGAKNFTALDDTTPTPIFGGHVGIGPFGADGAHILAGENISFAISYVSSSGNVDPSTLAFRFDQLGIRVLGGNLNTSSWTINGGVATNFSSATSGDAYRTVDTGFTAIGTTPNAYSGLLTIGGSTDVQLSSLPSAPTNGDGTKGLQMSVQFSTVPEPSSMLMVGLGAMVVGVRRRRA